MKCELYHILILCQGRLRRLLCIVSMRVLLEVIRTVSVLGLSGPGFLHVDGSHWKTLALNPHVIAWLLITPRGIYDGHPLLSCTALNLQPKQFIHVLDTLTLKTQAKILTGGPLLAMSSTKPPQILP